MVITKKEFEAPPPTDPLVEQLATKFLLEQFNEIDDALYERLVDFVDDEVGGSGMSYSELETVAETVATFLEQADISVKFNASE